MKRFLTTLAVLLMIVPLISQAQTTVPDKPVHNAPGKAALTPEQAAVIKTIDSNMIKIYGGPFNMGCTDPNDSCYYWEKPDHRVIVSSFYMNKFSVTEREWFAIMGTKPWFTQDCPNCPVQMVSWHDAQMFINKLNQLSGKLYRLPTEAEWEYAARGGNQSKAYRYAGSDDVTKVAWLDINSNKKTHPVGLKQPNELGLYDMSGNVWQWCSDWFDDNYYKNSPVENPQGPKSGTYKHCRGGSWWSVKSDLRVANRDRYPADAKDDDVGFRLAASE